MSETQPVPDPTYDPTGGALPATEFPPDEFPDPPQDPAIEVGPDGATTAVTRPPEETLQ